MGRLLYRDFAENSFIKADHTPTVGELIGWVLEQQRIVHPRTYPTDEFASRHILRSFLSKVKISELTELQWARYVAQSPNRKLFNDRRVLKKMLSLIKTRPDLLCKMVELPRMRLSRWHMTSSKGKEVPREVLSKIFLFLSRCEPERAARWRCAIFLGAMCGLRRGEVARLSVKEIEFESQRLYFPESTTKDGKERLVPLPPMVLEAIRERLTWVDGGYLFPSKDNPNEPMRPGSLYTAWKRLLIRAQVPHYRFHDLRHTAITQLVRANKFSLADIGKSMGASPSVLGRVYHHVNTEVRDDMARALEESFSGIG